MLSVPPFDVQIQLGTTGFTWTNMPAAETTYGGIALVVARMGDWRRFTQVRISQLVFSPGTAGSVFYLKYSTDGSAYSTLTTNQLSGASAGATITTWEAIPAAARIDAPWVQAFGSGGDGAVDPVLAMLAIHLK